MTRKKKPAPAKPVRWWAAWPQEIAPSEAGPFRRPKTKSERGRAPGYQYKLLYVAKRLADRLDDMPLAKIVVFYPAWARPHVARNLQRARKKLGALSEFQGLSVCATRSLRELCMAFRIEDVENHRTPADAYYIRIQGGKAGKLEPVPLYTEEESNLGKEIVE